MIKKNKWKIIVLSILTLTACDGIGLTGGGSQNEVNEDQQSLSDVYFSTQVENLDVEVYYEPSAVPETGSLLLDGDTWSYTQESVKGLFSSFSDRTFAIPSKIDEMTEINDQNEKLWSVEEMNMLGDTLFPDPVTVENTKVGVIFVSGSYEESNTVLGIHLSGKPYTFIFKDIISSASSSQNEQKLMEQAVIVHELGHAFGLVNNGIPLTTSHEDTAHPKHTSDEEGVMYWAVERKNTIGNFIDVFQQGSKNLFGEFSMQDATSYQVKP